MLQDRVVRVLGPGPAGLLGVFLALFTRPWFRCLGTRFRMQLSTPRMTPRMKRSDQPGLFESNPPLPEGFKYQPDLLSADEERDLVRQVEVLPFKDFEFQGFLGKRRVVSFGWKYDFNDRKLQKADDMPAFLLPLRRRAAAFAGLTADDFQHVLVTEYS